MKIAGIVCEYNPFHNGHLYHIAQTREAGFTHIVCVMSGNFVQRGEPAILSKRARAAAALSCGADLVIELPVPWACASAQTFARGAVGLLHAVGAKCVSFGSETADILRLMRCAGALDDTFLQSMIRELIGEYGYPAAVRRAVGVCYGEGLARILDKPNDTLNVEYIRAGQPYGLYFHAVKRDQPHDGDQLSGKMLRERIRAGEDISPFVPPESLRLIRKELSDGFAPCEEEKIERAVLLSLRTMTAQDFKKTPGVAQGLENRIYRSVRNAGSLPALYDDIKTKRYTNAKIRRAVMLSFLDVQAEDAKGIPPYIRVLAANERGTEILSACKKRSVLPVLTKYSELEALDEKCRRIFEIENRAGDIYALCSPVVRPCGTEMTDKASFVK